MDIAVLGTGMVSRNLTRGLAALGHHVVVGTRSVEDTREREATDGFPSVAQWVADAGADLASFAEAAAGAEVVVNATGGLVTLTALEAAGRENLAGKVLIDVANPLDFSRGLPPRLLASDSDSLAEQIQRAFPEARVVKALNAMSAPVMIDPGSVGDGDHTTFVCGDDAGAREVVRGLLAELGHRDVIDLGDLTAARGLEMLLQAWMRLWSVLGTHEFQFKIVR